MLRNAPALVLALALFGAAVALAAPKVDVAYSEVQKQAIDAIEKQGGLVLRIAQSSDAHRVDYHLQGKGLTDAGLGQLKLVPGLVDLNLGSTQVTDAGLKAVGELAGLERLNLQGTKVTDAGLANIKGLAKLEYLNLYGCEAITDAGLEHLKALPALKALYVWQTKVTKDAAKKLMDEKKGLRINTGWDLTPVVVVPVETPAAPKHVNSKCPVTGKDVAADKTLEHAGEVIAFCDDASREAFKKEPAKFLEKLVKDLKPKPSIAAVMKRAHKDGNLLKKTLDQKASADEAKELLALYEAMAAQKPPKGDEAAWKKLTGEIVDATKKVVAGDKAALEPLKKLTDCKGCHGTFKG